MFLKRSVESTNPGLQRYVVAGFWVIGVACSFSRVGAEFNRLVVVVVVVVVDRSLPRVGGNIRSQLEQTRPPTVDPTRFCDSSRASLSNTFLREIYRRPTQPASSCYLTRVSIGIPRQPNNNTTASNVISLSLSLCFRLYYNFELLIQRRRVSKHDRLLRLIFRLKKNAFEDENEFFLLLYKIR